MITLTAFKAKLRAGTPFMVRNPRRLAEMEECFGESG